MTDQESVAREQVAKGAEAKAKSVEQAYANQGKPTPTQEECDLAKLGVAIETHEDDGSGTQEERDARKAQHKNVEAKPSSGGYNTRSGATTHAGSSGSHSGGTGHGGNNEKSSKQQS